MCCDVKYYHRAGFKIKMTEFDEFQLVFWTLTTIYRFLKPATNGFATSFGSQQTKIIEISVKLQLHNIKFINLKYIPKLVCHVISTKTYPPWPYFSPLTNSPPTKHALQNNMQITDFNMHSSIAQQVLNRCDHNETICYRPFRVFLSYPTVAIYFRWRKMLNHENLYAWHASSFDTPMMFRRPIKNLQKQKKKKQQARKHVNLMSHRLLSLCP